AKTDSSVAVLDSFRIILFSATLGTFAAILLFPTFVNLWGRVITKLEIAGSLPKLLSSVSIAQLKNTRHYIRRPTIRLRSFRYLGVPKTFLLLNIVVTAIYTVGVLASLYA